MDLSVYLHKFIDESIKKRIFPGISIGVSHKCNNITEKNILFYGNYINEPLKRKLDKSIFFDLASLTKPFAVVLSVLSLIKEKKINLEATLPALAGGWDIPPFKSDITVAQLLSHSAGFPAHSNYFKKIVNVPLVQKKKLLQQLLLAEPLVYEPGRAVLYSDLGYMLLGLLVEELSGKALDVYLRDKILQPVGLDDRIFFNRAEQPVAEPDRFAACEFCTWRGRLLQGEVSDENCWAMGGVAGHAGLFGDIEGVLALVAMILDIWQGRSSHPSINTSDLGEFLKRRGGIDGSTWALGFDTPTPGKSSSGRYFSPDSVGHLGFTGTSFWIDPQRELAIVVLTNRVHPSRNNELIKEFRPLLHDKIIEFLGMESV